MPRKATTHKATVQAAADHAKPKNPTVSSGSNAELVVGALVRSMELVVERDAARAEAKRATESLDNLQERHQQLSGEWSTLSREYNHLIGTLSQVSFGLLLGEQFSASERILLLGRRVEELERSREEAERKRAEAERSQSRIVHQRDKAEAKCVELENKLKANNNSPPATQSCAQCANWDTTWDKAKPMRGTCSLNGISNLIATAWCPEWTKP